LLQTGYYDIAAKRYVLVWVATAPEQDAEPLLFIAVSETSDPTGQWSVKALTIKPSAATFKCTGSGSEEPFFVNYPQVKGRALGATCLSHGTGTLYQYKGVHQFLSVFLSHAHCAGSK
jgi:hypothetical protein